MFAVLLGQTEFETARDKGAALIQALKKSPVKWEKEGITLDAACGAHQIRPDDTADLALENADLAMYASKNSARNRPVRR